MFLYLLAILFLWQAVGEEVKIRIADNNHAVVVVGGFEYDHPGSVLRRRKFQHHRDATTPEGSPKKARPFKRPIEASHEKADSVFFAMSNNGWDEKTFHLMDNNCMDFSYEFVCRLFDGECPRKRNWPQNFVQMDDNMVHDHAGLERRFGKRSDPKSVFERQPNLEDQPNNAYTNCELKEHEFKFRITNSNRLRGATLGARYFTGMYSDAKPRFEKVMLIEEDVHVEVEGRNPVYRTALVAYECKIRGALHSFVQFLEIFDVTKSSNGMPIEIGTMYSTYLVDLNRLGEEVLEVQLKDGKVPTVVKINEGLQTCCKSVLGSLKLKDANFKKHYVTDARDEATLLAVEKPTRLVKKTLVVKQPSGDIMDVIRGALDDLGSKLDAQLQSVGEDMLAHVDNVLQLGVESKLADTEQALDKLEETKNALEERAKQTSKSVGEQVAEELHELVDKMVVTFA